MKTGSLRDREGEFASKPQGSKLRKQVLLIVVLIGLAGLFASDARAAFSDDFDSLLADLQPLAATLSTNTNKTVQKQYKVVVKAIAAINKPSSSLATDLKTASKIATSLQKAFPGDATLSNLVADVFAGIQSDASDDLNALQAAAEELSAGKAQTKALAAVASAETALTTADAAPNQKSLVTALGSALKLITGGNKDLTIASTSGGGSSSGGQYLKANIGGRSFTAKILTVTNALDDPQTIVLDGATRVVHSANNFDYQEIGIGFINFSGMGVYNGDDTPDTDFEFFYLHDTATIGEQWETDADGGGGTVTINSYDPDKGTAGGSFDVIVVNDDNLDESMEITGSFLLTGDELKGY